MKQSIRSVVLLTGLTTTSIVVLFLRKQKENKESSKEIKKDFEKHLNRTLKYILAGHEYHSQCLFTVSKTMKELPVEPPFEIEMIKEDEQKDVRDIERELNIPEEIQMNGKDGHFLFCISVTTVLSKEIFKLPFIIPKLPKNIKKKNIVIVVTSKHTEQQIKESKEILQRNAQVQDFFGGSPVLSVSDKPVEFFYPFTLIMPAHSFYYSAYLGSLAKFKKTIV
ncbi:Hypothetical predicted protein [Mytilus galloprovincialis]|uniref:Uncharacterized protein n=1 Tax=Mytilus galloprovincialis TaxID=29158 RepID=A0A8B6BLC9_MYTGA|nr:Hypothetical predicted protein [Mytilus galloprovincialis]